MYTDDEKAKRQIRVGLLADQGWGPQSIAAEVGVTRSTVLSDLRAMDMIPAPQPRRGRPQAVVSVDDQQLQRVRDMVSQGFTMRQMAHQLGVSVRVVSRLKRDAGVAAKSRHLAPEVVRLCERLLVEGCSYQHVSTATGVSRRTLMRRFPGMGLDRATAAVGGEASAAARRAS